MLENNGHHMLYPMHDVCAFPLQSDLCSGELYRKLHDNTVGVHLAVTPDPWFRWILDGSKTIESRFSSNRCAPYGKVRSGDIVFLKKGTVSAAFCVGKVRDFDLSQHRVSDLETRYSLGIHADHSFWTERQEKRYCTLMQVSWLVTFPGFRIAKNDRRGWVVLREGLPHLAWAIP